MVQEKRKKMCFVVNPFAGIGGPLGFKGSDDLARRGIIPTGLSPVAPHRAKRFMLALRELGLGSRFEILTADGIMGYEAVAGAGLAGSTVYTPSTRPTSRRDTIACVRECILRGADIVVFVGGDGTARDVVEGLGNEALPILGVPSGVKMYSSVFASTPEAAARALGDWVSGKAAVCSGEVVDVDENEFRANKLRLRLYAVVPTLCSRWVVGVSKQPSGASEEEAENARAIARAVVEEYVGDCVLLVLGPGTTTKAIADLLGLPKTLLGVDVYHDGRVVALDVSEEELYRIVSEHKEKGGDIVIVVSPIGGQGFILGRGNQQISPRILRLVGPDKLVVVATRHKLARLRKLRVDTGDPALDEELRGYRRVIVDYGEEAVVRVE